MRKLFLCIAMLTACGADDAAVPSVDAGAELEVAHEQCVEVLTWKCDGVRVCGGDAQGDICAGGIVEVCARNRTELSPTAFATCESSLSATYDRCLAGPEPDLNGPARMCVTAFDSWK